MDSCKLTALQRAILKAFFRSERGFFLTGGAALAGFYLGHRSTDDLDLFTVSEGAFERGRHVLGEVAADLGGDLVTRQNAPGFQRHVLTVGVEAVVVDLVYERAVQLFKDKPEHDGVFVDPIEEILANKLTTIAGRAEERDLIDLLHIEREGYAVEKALGGALQKDGGCTPATLAWLLYEISIPESASLPAGVGAAELREYVAELVVRLRKAALPNSR